MTLSWDNQGFTSGQDEQSLTAIYQIESQSLNQSGYLVDTVCQVVLYKHIHTTNLFSVKPYWVNRLKFIRTHYRKYQNTVIITVILCH